jgi:hypothetical protein
MDVFAHFLWTYAVFCRYKKALLAGVFGVLPDLAAFVPFIVYRLMHGSFEFGKPELATIPEWVFQLYNVSHSAVIFFAVFGLVWILIGKPQWYLGGWLVHIIIDIPTHTKEFFPTPVFYPLSGVTFDGISWANPIFMVVNYGAIVLTYIWIFYERKKR